MMTLNLDDKRAAVRGAIIGSAVGFMLGGPFGMILGGGLSAALHGLFGTTIDKMTGRVL
jgi:uncharacterized protein YqgC (DUF456 family)